ncbi:MAG: DNA-binding transcriptional regulator Fis [Gammaproteobacteria bacterium]|nr:DNA-binding transcriptional regulator Fis [Gammaproteobacteria bacterium]MDH5593456.1 DNA-binding transcriptional regulator Fis [Gammaproteobacteria bacterium]MDH5614611.1 DNA-binding transcriptional regulator Fis [Gammaproteobacteria bacterium]
MLEEQENINPIAVSDKPLRDYIKMAMETYFHNLDGQEPNELYRMVLGEMEQPLLETTMQYARGNQTKAAIMLGLNRSTLRKKLKLYGLD